MITYYTVIIHCSSINYFAEMKQGPNMFSVLILNLSSVSTKPEVVIFPQRYKDQLGYELLIVLFTVQ